MAERLDPIELALMRKEYGLLYESVAPTLGDERTHDILRVSWTAIESKMGWDWLTVGVVTRKLEPRLLYHDLALLALTHAIENPSTNARDCVLAVIGEWSKQAYQDANVHKVPSFDKDGKRSYTTQSRDMGWGSDAEAKAAEWRAPDEMSDVERTDAFDHVMQHLRENMYENYFEILTAYVHFGTVKEAAALVGCTPAAARKRLERARFQAAVLLDADMVTSLR